jgi:hypothetical protein
MLPINFYSRGLQTAVANYHNEVLDEEQFAQRNGCPIKLPSFRDRIFMQTGKLLIKEGRKLTLACLGHGWLDEEASGEVGLFRV